MTKYKIIIFGCDPEKMIHDHVSLKLYLFNVRGPVKGSPLLFDIRSMSAGVQINLDYNIIVAQQGDAYKVCGN